MQSRLGRFAALSLPLLFVCPVRAQSVDPTVVAADTAYTAKRYAEAIPLYQQVVASKLPDGVRARAQFQIGWSYYNLDNRKQAQAEWVAAADKFPTQASYACNSLLRAGNSAVGAKDYTSAATYYQRAADTYTTAAEAREFAIQARCWLGNVHLRMAEQTKLRESRTALATGSVTTGEEIWKQAAPDFHAAEDAYSRVLKDFPEAGILRAEAEMLLVSLKLEYAIYGQGNSFEDVIAAAGAFLSKWPDDSTRCPTVLMMRAESCFCMRRYDASIADITTIQTTYAATAKESLGTSQFYMARCYEDMHDWARALAEYTNYLELAVPSFNERLLHSQAQFFTGHCLRGLGKTADAAAAYQKVIDDYADCPIARSAAIYRDDLAAELQRDGILQPTLGASEGSSK
ncbi:MAG TPA: tetratricopeptide repeat protein [Armatimonadota bacterium]|jgi:tetratricopeptide (TPR) repeat protein